MHDGKVRREKKMCVMRVTNENGLEPDWFLCATQNRINKWFASTCHY